MAPAHCCAAALIFSVFRGNYLRPKRVAQGERLCFRWRAYVRLSAGLRKNYPTDFHETRWKGVAWPHLEPIKFWSWSEARGGVHDPFLGSWCTRPRSKANISDAIHDIIIPEKSDVIEKSYVIDQSPERVMSQWCHISQAHAIAMVICSMAPFRTFR